MTCEVKLCSWSRLTMYFQFYIAQAKSISFEQKWEFGCFRGGKSIGKRSFRKQYNVLVKVSGGLVSFGIINQVDRTVTAG